MFLIMQENRLQFIFARYFHDDQHSKNICTNNKERQDAELTLLQRCFNVAPGDCATLQYFVMIYGS